MRSFKFELWGTGLSLYHNDSAERCYGAYVSGVIRINNEIMWYAFVGGNGKAHQ